MYRHILIASDGSELATKAVRQGVDLAQALKANVTILTITPPFPLPAYGSLPAGPLVDAFEKSTHDSATRALAEASEIARGKGVIYEAVHLKNELEVADAIINTATGKGCDLIVMASHGYRGVKRLLLGSVALHVLTASKLPVLICR